MNSFSIVRLEQFIQEFQDNLNPETPMYQVFMDAAQSLTFDTYNEIIKAETKQVAPIPLYFDSPQSLLHWVKDPKVQQEIFNIFDKNKIGRIDAFEFLTTFLLCCDTSQFDKIWMIIVKNFGNENEEDSVINSDELFYFIDTLFRGLAKILIKKDETMEMHTPRNYRLDHVDINQMLKELLKDEKTATKQQLTTNANNYAFFKDFLEYIYRAVKESKDKKAQK